MGGNGGIDLSTIPLMTQAQEGALAELLPAVMGMMSGFPLGEAYQPGAYNVRTFPEFAGEHIRKKNGEEDGRNGDKIRREQLVDPNKRTTKEQLTAPDGGIVVDGDGRREVIRDGTVVPKGEYSGAIQPPTGGTTTGGQISEPVLDLILNPPPGGIQPGTPQIPPTGGITAPGTIGGPVTPPGGTTPGGKGGVPITTNIPNVQTPETQPISPIQQAITQPFTQPFREGMTGNYPRREVRR